MQSLDKYLKIIRVGGTLSKDEAKESLGLIMTGKISEDEIAEFLIILNKRGETIDEIVGMAETMRDLSNHVNVDYKVLDTCGTGGSGLMRFNVSTISTFVLGSLGVKIAKHGNRAQSGRVGSFDLLEGLGAKIELNPSQVARTIHKTNIGFMFAPLFHPAMKYVMPVRKELKTKTVFNILGPLTNPAHAQFQLLGTSSNELSEKIATVLQQLGTEKSLVVHGNDGLDELTISDISTIYEITKNNIKKSIINPKDFNINVSSFADIKGGDLEENIKICKNILKGKDKSGKSDMIVLNSAAGLYVYGKVGSINEGIVLSREALSSKIAYKKLEEYIDVSRSV